MGLLFLATWLVSAFVFRCVPFVVYALLSPSVRRDSAFVAAVLFVALAVAADVLAVPLDEAILHPTIALAYFAGVALVFRRFRDAFVTLPWAGPLLLTLLAFTYLLVPVLLVPAPIVVPAVALGWEAMLATYSYCRESSGKPSSTEDCLTFILVNPTLVYPERGKRIARDDIQWSGAIRSGVGLATWCGQAVVVQTLPGIADGLSTSSEFGRLLSGPTFYLGNALALYWAHSGLASVQIGLMRVAGWAVPERYRYPFFATSPSDFWRRWNVYVGSWARRYLFVPFALRLGRISWIGRTAGKAFALMGTFVGIGLLHAAISSIAAWVGAPRAWSAAVVMTLFVAFGLLFLVWEGVVRFGPRVVARRKPTRVASLLGWVLLTNSLISIFWVTLHSTWLRSTGGL